MGTYLAHHGILGQKWGKRNGPPYPLGYEDHSAAEKKQNSKSRIDGKAGTSSKKKSKSKFSKESLNRHRKKMLERYKGDKEMQKYYRDASDKEIQEDIKRKENIKKALIIGGAIVGVGVAALIAYKMHSKALAGSDELNLRMPDLPDFAAKLVDLGKRVGLTALGV